MTGTDLVSVRLDGSEARIRKVFRDLNGRATTIVRGGAGTLYVSIPASELGWLDKVARDFGCRKLEVQSLPLHEKALCGVLTTDRQHHESSCRACARLRQERPKVGKVPGAPKASQAVTVGKIEPGQNFDLNGVIASLELTYDRMFAQLEQLENLVSNLKGYRDAEGKLAELEQEVKDRISAARNLLNSGKF